MIEKKRREEGYGRSDTTTVRGKGEGYGFYYKDVCMERGGIDCGPRAAR